MDFMARGALISDPRLTSLDGAPAPALLVALDGEILWANGAGAALGGGTRLDPAGARAVASLGRAALVRLRIGAAGRFEAIAFRSSVFQFDGIGPLVLLEALAGAPRRPWAAAKPIAPSADAADVGAPSDAPADPDHASTPTFARDAEVLTSSDDVGQIPAADTANSLFVMDDRPPDPRTDLGTSSAQIASDAAPASYPADPEQALPAEELEARNVAPTRFVFEIDRDGRIAFLSPDLAAAVGASAGSAVGRGWSEVADELRLDPAGAVAAAIAGRSGWSALAITWPATDGRPVGFALSALPVFDRGRTFMGFRGLGSEIEAPARGLDQAIALEAAAAEPREAADAPTARDGSAVLSASEPERPVHAANVVPLRAALDPSDPLGERSPALSRIEESAFDEIARRLAADGDPLADVPSAREVWQDIAADAELQIGLDEREPPAAAAGPVAQGSAEDLSRLLDRTPLGMVVLQAGVIVYANRNALDMAGRLDLVDLAGRPADTLFATSVETDDAAPKPIRLTARDGVEVDAEAQVSPVIWGGEAATAVVLKRAEGVTAALAAAHARERELSSILDTATDGVLTLDGAGRILTINHSAEALFGYEAREIVGSLFSLALAPESRRIAYDYLDGLKSSAVASLLNDGREVLGLVRQGGAIPLYMTLGRVGSGDDGRYCAVLRDITPWKKAEEDLVSAKRQAERASAQKSEFLARVSHEIRTPLNAIIGFAEVMIEERFGAIGNERYRDYLKDIHLSGQHLISLVNDLLDLSKIESGKIELTFADVDLNQLVAESAALLQVQANRAHIIIRTSLARHLPPVKADARSIRQIVLNLASNAVKFTQSGGQVIVATTLNDMGEPVIRVRDTGVGMSRKEIALALEPFRQLPSGSADGAGLGLPLTKALAEANLAQFAIRSAVGEGTLVEVTFPSVRSAAE